jgi:putative phosphoribosyl transferase
MRTVRVHLPFTDRAEAGRLLAQELAQREIVLPAIVLALARGGVPIGALVAERLHLPLDVVVVRKIGVPWQPELAMGAIAGDARVLDESLIRQLAVSPSEVESIVARERAEMNRREELYRGGLPPVDLRGKTAILVDDGLAMGTTMIAAVQHACAAGAASIIAAVPVASREGLRRVDKAVDEAVCLAAPDDFCAVGQWYGEFEQVTDAEVENLLHASRHPSRAV